MPDDAFLLRRYARERAEEAFAELVRRYLDGVYSAALRRVGGDTHLAEDVAQQVFVALACNATRLSDREILSGWLYTTTRHIAANVVRTERRRKGREQHADFMNDADTGSLAGADWSRLAPLLDETMDQLGEADRTAILLRLVERRPFGEIGTALRVSEDAARMRVERALDKLRALLERRGIVSSSAALSLAMTSHAVASAPAGLSASVTTSATAATSAAGTMALGTVEIMSTAKSLGLAAALVAMITALGTAYYESQAHREAEAALAAEQKAHATQLAQRDETERRARQSEAEVVQLRKNVEDARAAQATAKARAAAEVEAVKQTPAWDGAVEGKAFLARHPDVKKLMTEARLTAFKTRYASFFTSEHLTPEQIEEFLQLRLVGAISGFPYGPGGKMLMLSVGPELSFDDVGNRLTALLGDDGVRRYQQFIARAAARDFAGRVADAMVFSDAPLSSAQASGLAELVATAWTKPRGVKVTASDWNAVVDQAQRLLSPPQLAALANARAQDEAQRALSTGPRVP